MKDANHASYHTPLLLAWFFLRYMLYGDDEDINNAQTLGNVALQNDVFGVILKMLRSPFFSGDRVSLLDIHTCTRIDVYSLIVTYTSIDHL